MKKYILFLLLPSIIFANTVANITALKGTADIKYKEELIPAKLKDGLIKENSLITYEKGLAQLLFEDKTIVSVGKNSNFSIEEYLGIETDTPKTQFNLLKGAMRVITGQIGKANPQFFKIKTKTAVIGIRGTNFIVINVPGEGDMVICTQGAIYVTGKDGKEHYVEKGYMTRLDKNGNVEGVKPFKSDDLDVILTTIFGDSNRNLSTSDLLTFFDYAFDNDPTNDERENKEEQNEKKDGNAKVYLSKDEKVETDNLRVIPLQETIVLDEKEAEKVKDIQDKVNYVAQDTAQKDIQDKVNYVAQDTAQNTLEEKISYLYGTGNTATIIDETNLINYYNRLGLSLAIDTQNKSFSQDSIAIDTRTKTIFTFDPQLTNFNSAYDFSGTFAKNTYTDNNSTYKVKDGSYITTISDLDANDEVTWGEWLIPIEVKNSDDVSDQIWRGNFIAGELTPSSVISSYAQGNFRGTYTGSLIGQAFEFQGSSLLTTDFNGLVVSEVDFGAGTVDSTLNFNVNNTNYNETLNDTIDGNRFSGTNSTGAFYGADGKTLAGEFNINDAENNRQLTGAFEAKTNLLTN